MGDIDKEIIKFDDSISRYEDDGVICMRGVTDPFAAIALLREAERPKSTGDSYADDMGMSKRLSGYWDCVSPLIPLAGRLMRSSTVRLYNDHLFIKAPGASKPTDWHQDLPFWPFNGKQIIAGWLALTPVRKNASALQYLRGSHRRGKYYRPIVEAASDPTDLEYLAMETAPDFFDPALRSTEEILSWDMEPGDVLWHNSLTIHGAEANNADNPKRAGLTIRFLGDDVTWHPKPYLRPGSAIPTLSAGEPISKTDMFPLLWSAKG